MGWNLKTFAAPFFIYSNEIKSNQWRATRSWVPKPGRLRLIGNCILPLAANVNTNHLSLHSPAMNCQLIQGATLAPHNDHYDPTDHLLQMQVAKEDE